MCSFCLTYSTIYNETVVVVIIIFNTHMEIKNVIMIYVNQNTCKCWSRIFDSYLWNAIWLKLSAPNTLLWGIFFKQQIFQYLPVFFSVLVKYASHQISLWCLLTFLALCHCRLINTKHHSAHLHSIWRTITRLADYCNCPNFALYPIEQHTSWREHSPMQDCGY